MNKHTKCAYLEVATVPEISRLCHRTLYHLKSGGVIFTFKLILRKLAGLPKPRTGSTAPLFDEIMDLKPGDVVEIKSADEVRRTLDATDKTKGLLFMPEMWKYCGHQYVVYKRISTILVESTGKKRHLKNTVVLTGVHCDGSEHFNCDSSCFHFWREAWLKKVPR